jgi:hypothetical protein
MVTDVQNDTGFVVPIRAAERLSNIRFVLLPQLFAGWTDLKNERDALLGQVTNLEQQVAEAKKIAENRRQANALLDNRLKDTEKVLKRKSFALKFYRFTTIALGAAAATLFITR